MALALALRHASKVTTGAMQQNFARSTAITIHRDLSANSEKRTLKLVPAPHTVLQRRSMSADHTKLWTIEKAVSLGLIALVPAAVAYPNVVFDNLAAVATVTHFHWGLEAVVVDYARPIVMGSVLPKILMGLLYLLSATTLGGLIYYNVSDIGIGRTIRKLWAIKE